MLLSQSERERARERGRGTGRGDARCHIHTSDVAAHPSPGLHQSSSSSRREREAEREKSEGRRRTRDDQGPGESPEPDGAVHERLGAKVPQRDGVRREGEVVHAARGRGFDVRLSKEGRGGRARARRKGRARGGGEGGEEEGRVNNPHLASRRTSAGSRNARLDADVVRRVEAHARRRERPHAKQARLERVDWARAALRGSALVRLVARGRGGGRERDGPEAGERA